MKSIKKSISLSVKAKQAFHIFVYNFNDWWPGEYTWSQELLQKIYIGKEQGELCTEIGPHGFRCDWGRITNIIQDKKVEFTWQISPKREPVPNPENASKVCVVFSDDGTGANILLEHMNFEQHGEEAESYRAMMDSPQGWPFILDRYKDYCEKKY